MPKLRSLMIALPNQGQIATSTMKSILGLVSDCGEAGAQVIVTTHEFSDIVVSRNALMSRFLAETGMSHCLWLDSDISYDPRIVWRMAAFDKDWVVATYAQKRMPWNAMRAAFEAEAALPDADKTATASLLSQVWHYNHQPGAFEGEDFSPKREGDFVTVQGCGAGFMLMSRRVPERMVAEEAATALPRMNKTEGKTTIAAYDFFSHLRSPQGDYLYAEDQSICLRWTRLGGDIWMDTAAVLGHTGDHTWLGQYRAALDASAVGPSRR